MAMLRDTRLVVAFERGRVKKSDLEREIRKYKKDYAIDWREEKNKK